MQAGRVKTLFILLLGKLEGSTPPYGKYIPIVAHGMELKEDKSEKVLLHCKVRGVNVECGGNKRFKYSGLCTQYSRIQTFGYSPAGRG